MVNRKNLARTASLGRNYGFLSLIALLSLSGCEGCESSPKSEATVESNSPAHESNSNSSSASTHESSRQSVDSSETSSAVPNTSKASTTEPRDGETHPQLPSSSPATPTLALTQAKEFHRKSRHLTSEGNPGEAYREAIRGWQLVNRFPNDPACRELAGQLLLEMEPLGEKANSNIDAENTSQPLMVR